MLPVPVYRLKNGRLMLREDVAARAAWSDVEEIPFFALPPGRRSEDTIPVGSLFFALPATGPTSRESLAGQWSCGYGGGSKLLLILRRSGALVSGTLDGNDIANAVLDDETLAFEVNVDGESYQISLARGDGKLTGRWKKIGEEGALDCGSLEGVDWTKSPDVVPVYGYRRADGSVTYSTDAALKDSGLKRSDAPVGRVWRNPMRVLALDPAAVVR
jgi:hypothetical protein